MCPNSLEPNLTLPYFIIIEVPSNDAMKYSRIVDLDIDVGADAVDYKYVLPPSYCDFH